MNKKVDFRYMKSGLKTFDSLYKEFKTDIRSKDELGTIDSYFALLDKLYSLRKQMEKAQDYYEN